MTNETPLKPGDLVELVGEPTLWSRHHKKVIPYGGMGANIAEVFKNGPVRVESVDCDGDVNVGGDTGWLLHPSCLRRVKPALPAGDAKPEDWQLGGQKVWTGENDGHVYILLFGEGIEIEPEAIQFAKEIVKHLSAMIRRAEGGER